MELNHIERLFLALAVAAEIFAFSVCLFCVFQKKLSKSVRLGFFVNSIIIVIMSGLAYYLVFLMHQFPLFPLSPVNKALTPIYLFFLLVVPFSAAGFGFIWSAGNIKSNYRDSQKEKKPTSRFVLVLLILLASISVLSIPVILHFSSESLEQTQVDYAAAGSSDVVKLISFAQKALKDRDINTLFVIAENESTPPEILRSIYQLDQSSPDFHLSYGLARNKSTPPDILQAIAEKGNPADLLFIAGNPSISDETFKLLSTNSDETIRGGLLGNPKIPLYIVQQLANDSDQQTKYIANKILREKNIKPAESEQPVAAEKIITTTESTTQQEYWNGAWDPACATCWPSPQTQYNNHCTPKDCIMQGYYRCEPQSPALVPENDPRIVYLIKTGQCQFLR